MYRFAREQYSNLQAISIEAVELLGDEQALEAHVRGEVPKGGIQHTPLVNSLVSALKLEGKYSSYKKAVQSSHANAWFEEGVRAKEGEALSLTPKRGKSLQAVVYEIFSETEKVLDLQRELTNKMVTTLGDELASSTRVDPNWLPKLVVTMDKCKLHVRMCLFKTIIGGWTTSWRMHEPVKLPCISGCRGEQEDIKHYVNCSPLWVIVAELLGSSSPLRLEEKLCIVNPSPERVVRLALAFHCYHYAKSLFKDGTHNGHSLSPNYVQRAALDSGRTFLRRLN